MRSESCSISNLNIDCNDAISSKNLFRKWVIQSIPPIKLKNNNKKFGGNNV